MTPRRVNAEGIVQNAEFWNRETLTLTLSPPRGEGGRVNVPGNPSLFQTSSVFQLIPAYSNVFLGICSRRSAYSSLFQRNPTYSSLFQDKIFSGAQKQMKMNAEILKRQAILCAWKVQVGRNSQSLSLVAQFRFISSYFGMPFRAISNYFEVFRLISGYFDVFRDKKISQDFLTTDGHE
jgi:hypothetical protein